jgi:drug/metabolite transporter (DMT)-like permease
MAIVYGLLTSLSIGLADLFGRRVVNARGPIAAGVALQFVAIFTSIAALFVVDSSFGVGDFAIGLASGLGLGVGLWAYFSGLRRSSSAVVAPLVATLSAVIPFGYAVVRGADPTLIALLGAIVAVGGLVVITMGGGRVEHLRDGIRWGMISGFGYGFGLSIVIEASESSGSWPAVAQRVSAFALMIAVARSRSATIVPPQGLRAAALIAGMLAGGSTIFFLLGVQAGATSAVVTASLFPAVSVVVGRFVYRDDVEPRQIAGIGIVLLGVIFVATG